MTNAATPSPITSGEGLSNAEIRTLMHNYSRMHQPGHYSDTEFDCLQDVIGFVRAVVDLDRERRTASAASAPVAQSERDALDAARWRFWRERGAFSRQSAFAGNGTLDFVGLPVDAVPTTYTNDDFLRAVEKLTDAAIAAQQPADGGEA